MINLENYDLSESEKSYLHKVLKEIGYDPTVNQIWKIMDRVWNDYKCDQKKYSDKKYKKFYSHPIWILNGIFIEQHAYSMKHRENLSISINNLNAGKILDFGGGFGTLAKLIANNKSVNVDIYEPFPTNLGITSIKDFKNIKFVSKLKKDFYDVVVSTDVLEHVHDPLLIFLDLVYSTKKYGHIYIANCFTPVILCHLPCTFHLRLTFHIFCKMMGLRKVGSCSGNYAQIYQKMDDNKINIFLLRKLEICSKLIWFFLRPMRPIIRSILSILR